MAVVRTRVRMERCTGKSVPEARIEAKPVSVYNREISMRTHTTLTFLVAALWAFPVTAAALNLSIGDSVAGIGTNVAVSSAPKGTLHLTVEPPLGAAYEADATVASDGTATVSIPGSETEVSGHYAVTVRTSGGMEASGSFDVSPDSLDSSASGVESSADSIIANGSDTVTVTIVARDRFGNPLPGRPFSLVATRAADNVDPRSDKTDESGKQEFQVTTSAAGSISLRAVDLISGETLPTTVSIAASGGAPTAQTQGTYAMPPAGYGAMPSTYANPWAAWNPWAMPWGNPWGALPLQAQLTGFGTADHFSIEVPATLGINEFATIRILAQDRANQTVEDYTGTVQLTSTDPKANLPLGGDISFLPQNLGAKQLTLGLRFRTAGTQTLRAQDSANPALMGEVTVQVTGDASQTEGGKRIVITSPNAGSLVKGDSVTVQGTTDAFVNLVVEGGASPVTGDSNADGTFSIVVPLTPGVSSHTLRVRDEFQKLDSGPLTVSTDANPPEWKKISVQPETPREGDAVTIVAEASEALTVIRMSVDGTDVPAQANPPGGSTYIALVQSPAPGTHIVRINGEDAAGNAVAQEREFTVLSKGLPQVQQLTAVAKPKGVQLQWNAVNSPEVKAYRIYVGESADSFSFSLDTSQATTAAEITDLKPGTLYAFAVTALSGDGRESEQKSNVVQAMPQGMLLVATPQDAALSLDWTSLSQDPTIGSFILEYGVNAGALTEQRLLQGTQRTHMLRDLISGVEYFLKLTPVDVTGKRQDGMAATANATPAGSGFHPSAGNAIPAGTVFVRGADATHTGAPREPGLSRQGPSTILWLALGLVGVGIVVLARRNRATAVQVLRSEAPLVQL